MTNILSDAPRQHAAAPSRQWVWALLSFAGWITATAITLPVAAAVSPDAAVRVDVAVWIVLTAVLSLLVAAAAARVVFGAWPRIRGVALIVPALGVALAVAEELLLHEWAEQRFGYYDSEMVWWTAGLSGIVIATSLSTFGTLVAPLGARLAPLVCQALGAAAVVLVVASNVEGLSDGIGVESVPLAIAVGLCAVYVVVAVMVSWIDPRINRRI